MDLPTTQVYVEEEEDDVVEEEDEDFEKSEATTEAELEQQQQEAASVTTETLAKATARDGNIAPRLMQKISAKKSVEEETVLLASDVPALGVKSDHPSELDKVWITLWFDEQTNPIKCASNFQNAAISRVFSWTPKRLDEKVSAKKRVGEETVLMASNVPALEVKSDHPSELDKVWMDFYFIDFKKLKI